MELMLGMATKSDKVFDRSLFLCNSLICKEKEESGYDPSQKGNYFLPTTIKKHPAALRRRGLQRVAEIQQSAAGDFDIYPVNLDGTIGSGLLMLFLGPAHCSGPLQELEKEQCVLRTCTVTRYRWRDAVIYPARAYSFNPARGGIQFAAWSR